MKSELHFFRVTEFKKREILILMDYQFEKIDFAGDDLFYENDPRMIESRKIEFILSLRNKGKPHGFIQIVPLL